MSGIILWPSLNRARVIGPALPRWRGTTLAVTCRYRPPQHINCPTDPHRAGSIEDRSRTASRNRGRGLCPPPPYSCIHVGGPAAGTRRCTRIADALEFFHPDADFRYAVVVPKFQIAPTGHRLTPL